MAPPSSFPEGSPFTQLIAPCRPCVSFLFIHRVAQVSDQLLESTNDMLLNAGAIGRCLQEMGAVVADVSINNCLCDNLGYRLFVPRVYFRCVSSSAEDAVNVGYRIENFHVSNFRYFENFDISIYRAFDISKYRTLRYIEVTNFRYIYVSKTSMYRSSEISIYQSIENFDISKYRNFDLWYRTCFAPPSPGILVFAM